MPRSIHRSDLGYTESALHESMRLATVSPTGIPHVTTCDTSVGKKLPVIYPFSPSGHLPIFPTWPLMILQSVRNCPSFTHFHPVASYLLANWSILIRICNWLIFVVVFFFCHFWSFYSFIAFWYIFRFISEAFIHVRQILCGYNP